jgi:mono/diheme cytochrome c family protein
MPPPEAVTRDKRACDVAHSPFFPPALQEQIRNSKERTMPKRAISVLVFLLGVGAVGFLNLETTSATQQDIPVQLPPAYVPSGRQMFQEYCAACHGADGKGQGPIVPFFRALPPDLTTLAKRHDGTFPETYVWSVLLFGPGSRVHGSIEMPVWGPIFRELDHYNEAAVRQRIKNLCEYLESIQEK